jgi:vitamin B12 transporter
MAVFLSRAALAVALISISTAPIFTARIAVSPASAEEADIVVTPNRTAQSPSQVGSAFTVIRGEEIQRAGPSGVVEALRSVPGIGVVESGGPGGVTTLRIRGAEARHTLVLIDGIRVNDPSAGAGEFDFGVISPTDIERIEIVRGPQSALYGSDAIGGVVNIITRRGRGQPKGYVGVEAGSYGTKALRAGISGSKGDVWYSASLSAYDTAGFSRYGYRIGRLDRGYDYEPDSARKFAGNVRLGWRITDWLEAETGFQSYGLRAQYDAAFGALPDTPSQSTSTLTQGWTKLKATALDGRFVSTFSFFANRTDRIYRDVNYYTGPGTVFWDKYKYRGDRVGAEYQGDLKLGAYGSLVFGARFEDETALNSTISVSPFAGVTRAPNQSQSTGSVFGLWQGTVAERLHLSLGGRVDDVQGIDPLATWRATMAYDLTPFGTRLRASAGTGAKAPSLFQRFSPLFGNANLEPERSVGVDAGIEQDIAGGRAKLTGTVFHNRIRNLIDYDFATNRYMNVARAETTGLELGGEVSVIDAFARVKATFTYLEAKDATTGLDLARRPNQSGRLALVLTPWPNVVIEPSVTLVSERWSFSGERGRLAPYARVDVAARWQPREDLTLYLRGENLTDAKYQEVLDYGTPGRSIYGGLEVRW